MKSLKDFINIVDEAVLRSSDGKPVTDGSGKVVGTGSTTPAERVAAQAEVDKARNTAALPAGMTQADVDKARNAEEPDAVATAPSTAPAPPVATANAGDNSAEWASGRLPMANTAPEAPAQAAMPANRDSMTFGQAFKDARAKGETVFTWKGKKYGTQLAPSKPATPVQTKKPNPANQSGMPTQQDANKNPWTAEETAQYNDILKRVNSAKTQGEKDMANAEMLAWSQRVSKRMSSMSGPTATSESVGYAEDQNLVSIVHLAGLR